MAGKLTLEEEYNIYKEILPGLKKEIEVIIHENHPAKYQLDSIYEIYDVSEKKNLNNTDKLNLVKLTKILFTVKSKAHDRHDRVNPIRNAIISSGRFLDESDKQKLQASMRKNREIAVQKITPRAVGDVFGKFPIMLSEINPYAFGSNTLKMGGTTKKNGRKRKTKRRAKTKRKRRKRRTKTSRRKKTKSRRKKRRARK
jgi:hypothetical protein